MKVLLCLSYIFGVYAIGNESEYEKLFTQPQTPYPDNVDCGPNGTYSECSSRCEETCKYKSRGCPPRVCGGPCTCKAGYIIDEQVPGCVLFSDCTATKQLEVPSYQPTKLEKFGANYGHFPKSKPLSKPWKKET